MADKPSARPLFTCKWCFCTEHCESYLQLRKHVATHAGSRTCMWRGCTRTDATVNMKRHVVNHVAIKYRCPLCKKLFLSIWNMKKHGRNRNEHKGMTKYRCDFKNCKSLPFKSFDELCCHVGDHVSEHGRKKRLHHCPDVGCTEKYSNMHGLTRHVKKCHPHLLPKDSAKAKKGKVTQTFPCEEPGCTKSYTRQYNLDQHVENTHSNNWARITCKVCSKQFIRSGDYKRHEGTCTKTAERFYCLVRGCDQDFSTKVSLARHSDWHRSSPVFGPKCKLECPVEGCPRSFMLDKYVKRHLHHRHRSRTSAKSSSNNLPMVENDSIMETINEVVRNCMVGNNNILETMNAVVRNIKVENDNVLETMNEIATIARNCDVENDNMFEAMNEIASAGVDVSSDDSDEDLNTWMEKRLLKQSKTRKPTMSKVKAETNTLSSADEYELSESSSESSDSSTDDDSSDSDTSSRNCKVENDNILETINENETIARNCKVENDNNILETMNEIATINVNATIARNCDVENDNMLEAMNEIETMNKIATIARNCDVENDNMLEAMNEIETMNEIATIARNCDVEIDYVLEAMNEIETINENATNARNCDVENHNMLETNEIASAGDDVSSDDSDEDLNTWMKKRLLKQSKTKKQTMSKVKTETNTLSSADENELSESSSESSDSSTDDDSSDSDTSSRAEKDISYDYSEWESSDGFSEGSDCSLIDGYDDFSDPSLRYQNLKSMNSFLKNLKY